MSIERESKLDLKAIIKHVGAVVYRVLGSDLEVDDVVQEAMIKVVNFWHRLPHPATKRKSYITVVARNAAFDHLRRREKRLRNLNCFATLDEGDFRDEDDSRHFYAAPHYDLEPLDPFVREGVQSVVKQLHPNQRHVLLLNADDFTYEQISDQLNISIGTVRSRLHYAKKNARRKLISLVS